MSCGSFENSQVGKLRAECASPQASTSAAYFPVKFRY